jgi:hypothetical protein
MTRKLIIVIGAGCVLVLNFLFVLFMIAVGLIHDFKEKGRKW